MTATPWEARYDLARDVRLNVHYHQRLLTLVTWADRTMQAIMAVASVGAVAATAPTLAVVAATVAVLRPVLGVSSALSGHAAAFSAYRMLDSRLAPLVQRLRDGSPLAGDDAIWEQAQIEREQAEVREPALIVPIVTWWIRTSSQKAVLRELPGL